MFKYILRLLNPSDVKRKTSQQVIIKPIPAIHVDKLRNEANDTAGSSVYGLPWFYHNEYTEDRQKQN